jgi:PiT family inorganic phosphate transporter
MELILFSFAVLSLSLALFFSVTNGFNDASATVATMIACGAASPERAVVLAAIWGFAGAMLGGTAVALTMIGLVHIPLGETLVYLIFAALVAAIVWNLIVTIRGCPTLRPMHWSEDYSEQLLPQEAWTG